MTIIMILRVAAERFCLGVPLLMLPNLNQRLWPRGIEELKVLKETPALVPGEQTDLCQGFTRQLLGDCINRVRDTNIQRIHCV